MNTRNAKLAIDLTSLAIAISGGILAVGNQITAIANLPGWLTNSWPAFIAIATITDRVGNIILNYLKSKDSTL